jgi:ZIP family zinc transporter/zinc and cadmium transporter
VLVFLAILLHKLPEGLTISSLQIAGGMTHKQALGSAALLGVATVFGVLATGAVGFLRANGLALSAGVTIYVAASNLVPEFQGKRGWQLPVAFFLGAAAFFGAHQLLGAAGVH